MDKLILDKAIATLNTRKDEWARLPIAERIPLFQGATKKTAEVADNCLLYTSPSPRDS